LLREGRQGEPVSGGDIPGGDDVEVGQHRQRRRIDLLGFGRLAGIGQAKNIGARRVEPDRLQAGVAAERVKDVAAAVVAEVVAGPAGVEVVEVDQPEGAGVLEQRSQGVAAFQERPIVVAVVAEAAVVPIFQVELSQCHLVARDGRAEVIEARVDRWPARRRPSSGKAWPRREHCGPAAP
jgi:hypothetical protein